MLQGGREKKPQIKQYKNREIFGQKSGQKLQGHEKITRSFLDLQKLQGQNYKVTRLKFYSMIPTPLDGCVVR